MTSPGDREKRREILRLLGALESAWTNGRIDALRACFREDAVLVAPDLEQRLRGRDPIVASYAEFLEDAKLLSFASEPPTIDLFDDTAVTVTPWTVEYALEGEIHHETGSDLLVLKRDADGWRIAWRTLVVAGAGEGR